MLKRIKAKSYRDWLIAGRPLGPDDVYYRMYKDDKTSFHRAIKRISKQYENNESWKPSKQLNWIRIPSRDLLEKPEKGRYEVSLLSRGRIRLSYMNFRRFFEYG